VIVSPYEEAHFLREGVVDINAAVVGISKARWTFIEESNATEEQAKAIMCQQRFDVLPIVDDTVVKKYFRTHKWSDYSTISSETITHKDVIPFQTHIRDVIKGFVLDSRNFYFLHSERRIVGLISVVNLNCRQVKVYLFSLLSELEVCLGNFIAEHIPVDELLEISFGENAKEKHEDVLKRYEKDKALGVDAPLVEYLYLSDLINIISKKKLYERLGYSSRSCFDKNLGSLNDLRHAVAHPARSIITEEHPVEKLWERIDRVEEALFVLRLI
jgi:hypothetical protein